MIVLKFGGNSLATAECCERAAGIIRECLQDQPIVVVSAMGQTTEQLFKVGTQAAKGEVDCSEVLDYHDNMMKQLGLTEHSCNLAPLKDSVRATIGRIVARGECVQPELDELLAYGEQFSVRILTSYFTSIGLPASPIHSWDVGFVLSDGVRDAVSLEQVKNAIGNSALAGWDFYQSLPVVTGFIAQDQAGQITTLGRGGSDLTASLIGAALGVAEIQYWKDVDGILTADPRIVPDAFPVARISFKEAAELAYFSATVLHPASICPAQQHGIPVKVLNSYFPDHPGTSIIPACQRKMHQPTTICSKKNTTLVEIVSTRMLGQYGFLARVFNIFAELRISVDIVATSEVSLTLSLDEEQELNRLESALGQIAHVRLIPSISIINLIGLSSHSSEILERLFAGLKRVEVAVKMISLGTAGSNISFAVDDSQMVKAVRALHDTFFTRECTQLNAVS